MSVFSKADIAHPKRHFFDLSYENKFTFDMGELIPFCWQDVVPGDKVKIGVQSAIRFQPLVAPFMHSVFLYTHWFFVPSRLLFKDTDVEGMDKDKMFTNFITGGLDGDLTIDLPKLTTAPADFTVARYMGYPLVMPTITDDSKFQGFVSLPIRCYNLIYNQYYRDENLIDEVDLDNNSVLLSSWKKDYFTSSLKNQQRGEAPSLKFTFSDSPIYVKGGNNGTVFLRSNDTYDAIYNNTASTTTLGWRNSVSNELGLGVNTSNDDKLFTKKSNTDDSALIAKNDKLEVKFNASDLRLLMQVQRWQERNERCGIRYTEFLKSHYGISPRDEVLQRAEYIGGSKSAVRVSEVPQTSESGTTKQGTLAGKATVADVGYIGTYTAKEFGYIVGICKVLPELAYTAQGARRHLVNYSKLDYYSPEFAWLSERPVYDVELMASSSSDPFHIFGYQAQWNEMRANQNQAVCGMDDAFSFWNLNRVFANVPALNKDFIEANVSKRIFATPGQKGLVATFQNMLHMYRPLPKYSQPGLIDHTYGG